MQLCVPSNNKLDPQTRAFYRRVLQLLKAAQQPFLVCGAYALTHYTGIIRHTKDFDIFVHPRDWEQTLQILANAGYRTERSFPHWLGKVTAGDAFIDVIYSSGNGVAEVDDLWLKHGEECEVLGLPVRVCPVEEMIWSKSYVMERERYDGADIAHLLRARGPQLDWDRLLFRFGPHWRILLNHLILFGFIYPSELSIIPNAVMEELLQRTLSEQRQPPTQERICQGTLLSREQYLADIEQWGYRDARVAPQGKMTRSAIAQWTEAIDKS